MGEAEDGGWKRWMERIWVRRSWRGSWKEETGKEKFGGGFREGGFGLRR